MMKKFFCFLLVLAVSLSLCACARGTEPSAEDPAMLVSFLSSDALERVPSDAESVKATLNNLSSVTVTTGKTFRVFTETSGSSVQIGEGTVAQASLPAGTALEFDFPLGGMTLTAGATLRLELTVTCSIGHGDEKETTVSFFFRCEDTAEPIVSHDLLKSPISELTADEAKQLADYLFTTYIPCSYGIFNDISELSSASVWSSVEALNAVVDKDTSEQAHTLDDVMQKVSRYFPGADFEPTQVRAYNDTSKTFYASAVSVPAEEYVLLSYELKDGTISVFYEDAPDKNDPDTAPLQYCTTLKNADEEGYFAFIATVRSGAVG